MSTTRTARAFLALNAAFSVLSGAALIIMAGVISGAIFAAPADWVPLGLRLLGAGLLIFALDVWIMARNRFIRKKGVLLIVVADLVWLLASALLLLFGSQLLTGTGMLLIGVVAAFVAVFAIGQFIGAGKIVAPQSRVDIRTEDGVLVASVRRAVRAPASTVWKVMTDHPRYAEVAANISKVEVLSGEGLGMQRRCYGPKGENWRETCDHFEAGRSFGFKIHTEAEDYPYPIADLKGQWSVEPKGTRSEFAIDIEARPKGNAIVRALFAFAAKRQFTTVLIDLADAWSDRMEREANA